VMIKYTLLHTYTTIQNIYNEEIRTGLSNCVFLPFQYIHTLVYTFIKSASVIYILTANKAMRVH